MRFWRRGFLFAKTFDYHYTGVKIIDINIDFDKKGNWKDEGFNLLDMVYAS